MLKHLGFFTRPRPTEHTTSSQRSGKLAMASLLFCALTASNAVARQYIINSEATCLAAGFSWTAPASCISSSNYTINDRDAIVIRAQEPSDNGTFLVIEPNTVFTISGHGTLTLSNFQAILDNRGALTNNGTIYNDGVFRTYSNSAFTNAGAVNTGALAIFILSGSVTNSGTITFSGGQIRNAATLNNTIDAKIYINGQIALIQDQASASFTNTGAITIQSGGALNLHGSGPLSNEQSGTVTIDAVGRLTTGQQFKIRNSARLRNDGTIDNAGTIVNSGGAITNENAATLTNSGTISNEGGQFFNQTTGHIVNAHDFFLSGSGLRNQGGTIANTGRISIASTMTLYNGEGSVVNNGSISNGGTLCGGMVSGNPVSGNPPIPTCP